MEDAPTKTARSPLRNSRLRLEHNEERNRRIPIPQRSRSATRTDRYSQISDYKRDDSPSDDGIMSQGNAGMT